MDDRKGGYILTYTGQKYWPLDPRAEDVHIADVAHALSNMCRFTGHVRNFYSVAEHSVRVAWQLPPGAYGVPATLAALLHDASEAYLVDVPSPIKCSPAFAEYREAEKANMAAIHKAFNIWPSKGEEERIHEADQRLLATEKRDLMPEDTELWSCLTHVKPLHCTIQPWQPLEAEFRFLEMFSDLTGSGAW